MKCKKCDGQGVIPNPHYYRYSSSEAYERGIPVTKTCPYCQGIGYIIGNINDIVERLECAANGVTISKEEAKQMLIAIKGGEK